MSKIKDALYAAKRINVILQTEETMENICPGRVDITENDYDSNDWADVRLEGCVSCSGLSIDVSAEVTHGYQTVSYFINGDKVSLRDGETLTRERVRKEIKNLTDELLATLQ